MAQVAKYCNYWKQQGPTSGVDGYYRSVHQIQYLIETEEPMAPGAAANDCLASGTNPPNVTLPDMWATYSFRGSTDPYSFLRSRRVDPLDWKNSELFWVVTDTYQPLEPNGLATDSVATNPNPVNRDPKFEWDREVYNKPLEHDITGKAIINSAGQPFDEPIDQEESRSVLIASYNVPSLAAVIALTRAYEGAVNATSWQGLNPRQALCREVTSSLLITENSYQYYNIRFRIAIHQDKDTNTPAALNAGTWDRAIMNRGFNAYQVDQNGAIKSPKKLGRIRTDGKVEGSGNDSSAEFTTEPMKLDANGLVLAPDMDATYRVFRTRPEVDFNSKVVTAAGFSQTGIGF